MTLVDSSVWIDYFRGVASAQTDQLDSLLGSEPLLVGDLILTEVLQGFRSESDYSKARSMLQSLELVELAGATICLKAAQNYRSLRAKGVTVRKPIDCIIATCCIERNYTLLHSDQDFSPFVEHLGLRASLP